MHVYLGFTGAHSSWRSQPERGARAGSRSPRRSQSHHRHVEARTRRPDGALSRYERAAALYRKIGRSREAAEVLLDAAELLLERGGTSDVSLASARLAAARDLIESNLVDDFRPRLKLLVSLVRAKNGDVEQALAELEALEAQLEAWQDRGSGGSGDCASWPLQKLGSEGALRQEGPRGLRAARGDGGASRVTPRCVPCRPTRARCWRAQRRSATRAADRQLVRLTEAVDARCRGDRDPERWRESVTIACLERITDAAIELSGAERGFVLW